MRQYQCKQIMTSIIPEVKFSQTYTFLIGHLNLSLSQQSNNLTKIVINGIV